MVDVFAAVGHICTNDRSYHHDSFLDGKPGVKKLLAKFLVWRVGFQWWLVAFLLAPVAILAATVINTLQGGNLGHFDPSQWYVVLLGSVFV
jgi:hypothetical protein